MEKYIGLLMLITPGFLVQYIHKKLTSGAKVKSDFDKTINSLMYSIVVLFMNYAVIAFMTDIKTIADFLKMLNSLLFIIEYIGLTFANTIIFSIAWSFIHPKLTTRLINKARKLNKLSKIEDKSVVWDIFLNDNTENKAIAVFKNGQQIGRGFVKNWSFPQNDEQEILLEMEDIMEAHPECFKVIEKTYYNIDKDVMIKEYNLDKLYSKLDEED